MFGVATVVTMDGEYGFENSYGVSHPSRYYEQQFVAKMIAVMDAKVGGSYLKHASVACPGI
jgi:hypothetical protein